MLDVPPSSRQRTVLGTLLARFDTDALLPPAPLADTTPGDPQAWQQLQRWCLAAEPRFSLASLQGPGAATLATLLCLERDGSLQMQACSSAAGRLALRLNTKLHDLMAWRARQAADAWDSGTAIATSAGLAALSRLQPRRATLIVADGLSDANLNGVLTVFQHQQSGFAHPVRLLLLGAAGSDRAALQISCR